MRATNLKEWRFVIKRNLRKSLPLWLLNLYFSFYPFVGNFIYGYPSRRIKIIGITGTDGKSSVVMFTARILKEAGYKVGYFSSVYYGDGDNECLNVHKMTMPGRFFLQGFLKKLAENKCDFAVIEVTSEGIKQKRHLFMDFDVALVTNIKPEHIESHGSFKKYKQAKSALFKKISKSYHKNIPKTIIANADDAEAETFLSFEAEQKIRFGIRRKADVRGQILYSDLFKNIFRLEMRGASSIIEMTAGGPFVVENALAAIVAASALGILLKPCVATLEKTSNPPGRFEVVSKNPMIIIDYAHTVVAVSKLLEFARKNWKGKIIHVFGAAGGGRDKWKRSLLAELSEKYCDVSILTEENSFDEPTEDILQNIYEGFKEKEKVIIIPNRKEAVSKAIEIQQSSKDILVLLTGKGSETVIAGPLGKKIPYNEKQTVLCLLDNY